MHMLALLLAVAAPATDTYPTSRGTWGVSFFLPGTGDSKLVGAETFLADDLALRLDAGLSLPITPSGPGQNKLFSVAAALRSYVVKRNRVGLFLQPGIALGHEQSPAVSAEAAFYLRLAGAVGVEYFFTNAFSVGATLELSLKLANLAGPAGTPVYTTVATDTSSLAANFYF